jgi:hypothetical protein
LDVNDEDFVAKVEKVVPMNYFVQLEAVNYLLGNPDCIRNNYNNYYTYFAPSGFAIFGVYDYDWSLGNTWNNNDVKTEYIKPNDVRGALGDCQNPLYRKTFLKGGNTYYNQLLKDKIAEILQGEYFTYEYYKTFMDAFWKSYQNLIEPSSVLKNSLTEVDCNYLSRFDGTTVQNYINTKRATAEKAMQ